MILESSAFRRGEYVKLLFVDVNLSELFAHRQSGRYEQQQSTNDFQRVELLRVGRNTAMSFNAPPPFIASYAITNERA